MADNTIFGATPAPTVDDVYVNQQDAAVDRYRPIYEAEVTNSENAVMGADRVYGPARARDRFEQRVNQRAAQRTPDMRKAELSTRVRKRINMGQLAGVAPEDMKEKILLMSIQEAEQMGEAEMAQSMGNQYAELVTARVKEEAELEKLNAETAYKQAQTEKTRQEVQKGATFDHEFVNPKDGHTYKQRINTDGNTPNGEPYLTKYGDYYQVGDQIFDPANNQVETYAQTEEKVAEELQGLQSAASEFEDIDEQLIKVEDALKNIGGGKAFGGWFTSGIIGETLSEYGSIPFVGNDAKLMIEQIKSIKSELAFGRLQKMRNESKTGGALGAISQKELDLLESSLASLDIGLAPQELYKNLQEIKRRYGNFKKIITRRVSLEDIDWTDPAYGQFVTPSSDGTLLITIGNEMFEATPE